MRAARFFATRLLRLLALVLSLSSCAPPKPPLAEVRRLAIDEIAAGHGHRYITIVLDLESGRMLFVGAGKGNEATLPFKRRLK